MTLLRVCMKALLVSTLHPSVQVQLRRALQQRDFRLWILQYEPDVNMGHFLQTQPDQPTQKLWTNPTHHGHSTFTKEENLRQAVATLRHEEAIRYSAEKNCKGFKN